jgi:peptide deformylase
MLELILAPDPIYKTICTPVDVVDDAVRTTLEAMMATLRAHQAMGLGGPMVGITQRLVVVELEDEAGVMHQYKMVNPVITERSIGMSTMEEGSITFLGISAPVTRPAEVTVEYLDENGAPKTLRASGILSVCIQHEMDYLDGKTFLDYQPPMKRDILKRKMEKNKRVGPHPHVHGPHCNH